MNLTRRDVPDLDPVSLRRHREPLAAWAEDELVGRREFPAQQSSRWRLQHWLQENYKVADSAWEHPLNESVHRQWGWNIVALLANLLLSLTLAASVLSC